MPIMYIMLSKSARMSSDGSWHSSTVHSSTSLTEDGPTLQFVSLNLVRRGG